MKNKTNWYKRIVLNILPCHLGYESLYLECEK